MIIIKNKQQIEGIRKACRLTVQTVEYITSFVKDGVTTNEIDALAHQFIVSHGGIPAPLNYGASKTKKGYPNATCISINEVICHGVPSERVIRKGDLVSIDISLSLDGYFGDMCTTIPVTPVSFEAMALMMTTLECLNVAIDVVKPYATFKEIGIAVTDHAKFNNYSVVEDLCGHGVGLQLHEPPQINHHSAVNMPYNHHEMKPGMIFTIEPMITQGSKECITSVDGWSVSTADGKLSSQFEHTVLVTKKGVEVLTSTPLLTEQYYYLNHPDLMKNQP